MLFSKRKRKPRLSIVVIAYNMPRQLQNTLYSLSTAYQQNVEKDDYEVIVMENQSANTLDTSMLEQLQGNFHYHLRQETLPSPVNAINEGISLARGDYIAVMIDGARMVTPGIIHHTLRAFKLSMNAVVAVPGYHLGREIQQESSFTHPPFSPLLVMSLVHIPPFSSAISEQDPG